MDESLGHRWNISKNKAIESFGPSSGVVGSVEFSGQNPSSEGGPTVSPVAYSGVAVLF